MRLCVVAYKFGREQEIGRHLGTYHYFIEKLRTLVRQGTEVTVVCPWLSFTRRGSSEVDGVKIVRYWPPLFRNPRLWPVSRLLEWIYIRQTQRAVLKLVSKAPFNAVYVWQARETGYAIARIKDKLGTKFIFRQITTWLWHFKRPLADIYGGRGWYKKLRSLGLGSFADRFLEVFLDRERQLRYAKFIYARADQVVFLSRAAAAEGRALGLPNGKQAILGVAIEPEIFCPSPDRKRLRRRLGLNGRKAVLFVGRINFAEKGLGYLVEAMAEVTKVIAQAVLVIVGGGGETERLKGFISHLRLSDHIQLVGKKPLRDLVYYINACDVMVVPSVWVEAFGQVTIEAMACGAAVVTSDAGASPEINIHGQTGLVVPAKDSGALATAIVKLLNDPALSSRFGEAGRQRVLSEYSYPVIVGRFLQIIKS